jgi:hypothetical protein
MNFRRGSDVPEGGESSGVARLGFAPLDFESPTWIEGEERMGRLQQLNRRGTILGSGQGYIYPSAVYRLYRHGLGTTEGTRKLRL